MSKDKYKWNDPQDFTEDSWKDPAEWDKSFSYAADIGVLEIGSRKLRCLGIAILWSIESLLETREQKNLRIATDLIDAIAEFDPHLNIIETKYNLHLKDMQKPLTTEMDIQQLRTLPAAKMFAYYAFKFFDTTMPNGIKDVAYRTATALALKQLVAEGHLSPGAPIDLVDESILEEERTRRYYGNNLLTAKRWLCEVVGNPFQPVTFTPEWCTDDVKQLAYTMYDSGEFSAMPILADALQDAGCDNDDILNHCRAPGVHVRGCWVLDLVLGKE
jgi:hypothetical protein